MAKGLFYGSPNKIMDFVWDNATSATLYSIANTLFMLEKKIKAGQMQKSVRINYYMDLSQEDLKMLNGFLRNLVLDVLCEKVEFSFNKCNLVASKNEPLEFKKRETICLFSGGVDSTLGILKAKEKYGDVVGLYVGHQDLGKITHKIDIVKKEILDRHSIDLVKLIAPSMGKGYSQLRGFLYVLYGSILANFVNASNMIIAECGATMYQPKFAPMDSITYTTHPLVLKASKQIAEIILKRQINLITPFEDFTKTEMMKLISDDSILSKTHSCLSARWDKNCGGCYACITRMIGSINLGLSTNYFKNTHFQDKNNEIISSLINFCFNFETNQGEVDYWSLKTIRMFDKEDLFHRHCLDVFLCLQRLAKIKELDSSYEVVLDSYLAYGKARDLADREKLLKTENKEPNFNKKVIL